MKYLVVSASIWQADSAAGSSCGFYLGNWRMGGKHVPLFTTLCLCHCETEGSWSMLHAGLQVNNWAVHPKSISVFPFILVFIVVGMRWGRKEPVFAESLLHVTPSAGSSVCILYFFIVLCPMKQALLFCPCYRWGHWSPEKWGDLSGVIQLIGGGAELSVQVCLNAKTMVLNVTSYCLKG